MKTLPVCGEGGRMPVAVPSCGRCESLVEGVAAGAIVDSADADTHTH